MKMSLHKWIGFTALLAVTSFIGFAMLLESDVNALGQAGWYQILSPSGTEQVPANNPNSAYQNFVNINQIRNATGYQYLTSASGTVAPSNAVNSLLINAQPAASTTINTPAAPFDGELFQVCNVSNAAWATNTVTLAAASGSSLATGVVTSLTTLAARSCEELQYVTSTTTWYQVR